MSPENVPYTGPVPDRIRDVMEKGDEVVRAGGYVYYKFTCAHCKARQTFEDQNALHATGTCEECGKVTDLLGDPASDIGFDAIIPTNPEAAALIKKLLP